jgi:hypothetical protein
MAKKRTSRKTSRKTKSTRGGTKRAARRGVQPIPPQRIGEPNVRYMARVGAMEKRAARGLEDDVQAIINGMSKVVIRSMIRFSFTLGKPYRPLPNGLFY